MARLSVTTAIGTGFGLVARYPVSVALWGVAYFVLSFAPVLAMWMSAGPEFLEFFRSVSEASESGAAAEPDVEAFTALNAELTLWQPLTWLTSLGAHGVLFAAVFRAALEPRNRGFAYLRLGKDELWQALLYLCLGVFAVALVIVAMLLGGAGVLIGAAMPSPAKGWVIALAVVAVVLALIWVMVRFSQAAPMTFAEKRFRLFESWALTKGHSWRLFGLALLLCLVVLAIEALIVGLAAAVMFGVGGVTRFDHDAIEAFFSQPIDVWMAVLAPWLIGVGLTCAVLTGALTAILLAPWASAYRQLVPNAQTSEI